MSIQGRTKKNRRAAVLARDGHRCLKCGSTEGLTLDHIVPRSKGGRSHRENLQTLCESCNAEKGNAVRDYRRPGAVTNPETPAPAGWPRRLPRPGRALGTVYFAWHPTYGLCPYASSPWFAMAQDRAAKHFGRPWKACAEDGWEIVRGTVIVRTHQPPTSRHD